MKLASIERISAVRVHPNADKLELATIQGWQAVVKRGDFRDGDLCVFVPPDTILPDAEWSAFLKDKSKPDKPIRLRTAKIRGEFSQGLVLPLTVLGEHARRWHEGADVGGELGVKKYEKEVSLAISGTEAGAFPLWLAPRTDEDNGLSNLKLAEYVLREPVLATIKLDGSSCTVVVEDGKILHVCSRNIDLKGEPGNAFWHAARKLKFPATFSGVVQGELMGPGIQGNQLELAEPTLYVFQVKTDGEWVNYDAMWVTAASVGAPHCWIVGEYKDYTVSELQERVADKMVLPNGKPAEGIVVRPLFNRASGSGRPLGFKLINRNYGE